MDKTSNKLSKVTSVIAIVNIVIFLLAFFVPTVALWLAVAVFAIFIALVILVNIFKAKLIAWLRKLEEETEKIENEAEKEKKQMEDFFLVILLLLFTISLKPFYRIWFSKLFGLLLSSVMAIIVIAFSGFWEIGQYMATFLVIISGYIFLRLMVRFTLNPLGENTALNKFSQFLKIFLELARIILIIMAVMGEDGTLAISWLSPTILMSIVATIAIDTIIATLEKIVQKPKTPENPEALESSETPETPKKLEDKTTVEVIDADET